MSVIAPRGFRAAGVAAGTVLGSPTLASEQNSDKVATKGRIKQSIVHWCFKDFWDVEKFSQIAKARAKGGSTRDCGPEPSFFYSPVAVLGAVDEHHGHAIGVLRP